MSDATISVFAGVNGAGKSSIAGERLRERGGEYFNPDEFARRLRAELPELSIHDSNAQAWAEGVKRLTTAIEHRQDFSFETTLGGATITNLLKEAAAKGIRLRIWYAGLSSVELHLKRVAARVAAGGHDIPEAAVRNRWASSHLNLIDLIPLATEVVVYDNSAEADPATGATPSPVLVLCIADRRITHPLGSALHETPQWAKPIVAAAYKSVPTVAPAERAKPARRERK